MYPPTIWYVLLLCHVIASPTSLQVLAELIRRKTAELANSPFPVMYEEELKEQLGRNRILRSLPNSDLQQAS